MHPQTTLATTDRRVSALGRGAACLLALGTLLLPTTSVAGELPDHQTLVAALKAAVGTDNGGFEYDLWATVVDRDGVVRAVAFSGTDRSRQWPGSRVISAQKAHTANAFSLPDVALSTANLYAAVQPGKPLFGLQESSPVDTAVAYGGTDADYGTEKDFMVGKKMGGINVFGGGLPLYDSEGRLLGALGVSGDTSCADHNVAWKVRHALELDYVPSGVARIRGKEHLSNDNIVYDDVEWAHPRCSDKSREAAELFYKTRPTRPSPVDRPRRKP
jgi:uncharacterized protein GlcG (DUF336 family)